MLNNNATFSTPSIPLQHWYLLYILRWPQLSNTQVKCLNKNEKKRAFWWNTLRCESTLIENCVYPYINSKRLCEFSMLLPGDGGFVFIPGRLKFWIASKKEKQSRVLMGARSHKECEICFFYLANRWHMAAREKTTITATTKTTHTAHNKSTKFLFRNVVVEIK